MHKTNSDELYAAAVTEVDKPVDTQEYDVTYE